MNISWKIIIIFSALALILSACGTAPMASLADSEPKLVDVIITCSDLRTDPTLLFGQDAITNSTLVIRRVGGAGTMGFGDFQELELQLARQNMQVRALVLIDHADDTCPACGGLQGYGQILSGETLPIPEIDTWLRTYGESASPYYAVQMAANNALSVFPEAEIDTAIQMNTSQRLFVIETRRATFVSESQWLQWPAQQLPLASSDEVVDAPFIRALLEANETAQPNANFVALARGYATGQPFDQLLITTRMDSAVTLEEAAGKFVVTVPPGTNGATEAMQQMSYAFGHAQPDATFTIVADNYADAGNIVAALNTSQTFLKTPLGKISVEMWPADMDVPLSITLRESGMGELFAPGVMGGVVLPARTMPFDVPQGVTQDAVAAELSQEGVVATTDEVAGLTAKLSAYAGTAVTVIAIGSDIVFAVYVATTAGDLIFAWGPAVVYGRVSMAPVDEVNYPDLASSLKVVKIGPVSGAPEAPAYPIEISTSGTGPNLLDAWDQITKRAIRGETPCFGITFTDRVARMMGLDNLIGSEFPTPIEICSGSKVVPNDPQSIVIVNVLTHAFVTFQWGSINGVPQWIAPSPMPDLSWLLTCPTPSAICTERVTFDATDNYRIHFTPVAQEK